MTRLTGHFWGYLKLYCARNRRTLLDTTPNSRTGCAVPEFEETVSWYVLATSGSEMKVKNSLKALKERHRDNQVVRRRGRLYIINKTQRRFKARQG